MWLKGSEENNFFHLLAKIFIAPATAIPTALSVESSFGEISRVGCLALDVECGNSREKRLRI